MVGRGHRAALALTLALVGASPAAAQVQSQAEKAKILATVQTFFDEFAKPNVEAMKPLLAPNAIFYSARKGADGAMAMQPVVASAWLERLPKTGPGVVERIWKPTVLQRGDIAVVWAPFDAKKDGKMVNCGIDSFDLVKLDGAWKITGLMWTSEPDACKALGSPG